jgi:hypothetical protein
VTAKHRELVESAKRRAGEYLLAAQQSLDQPNTENFMFIADGTDLNPSMLVRWQAYLGRTRKGHDPVFAPWHALAALPGGVWGAPRLRDRSVHSHGSHNEGENCSWTYSNLTSQGLWRRSHPAAGRGGAEMGRSFW